MALSVTSFAFSEDDLATRILPALCPCLIDKEKIVRDQANKTIEIYLKRIRKFASTMPDTILTPIVDISNGAPRMCTLPPNDAPSWTGWAISSFTNKISGIAGDINPCNPPTSPITRSASTSSTKAFTSTPTDLSRIHENVAGKLPNKSDPSPNFQVPTTESRLDSTVDEGVEIDNVLDNNEDIFDFFPGTTDLNKTNSTSAPESVNEELDFSDWLATQALTRANSKPLPKGLARQPAVSKSAPVSNIRRLNSKVSNSSKPITRVISKKIDTTPNENAEDDGWGDGW